MKGSMKRAGWFAGGAVGAAAIAGLGHMAFTWYGYGKGRTDGPVDPLLDRFIPTYEVREGRRSRIREDRMEPRRRTAGCGALALLHGDEGGHHRRRLARSVPAVLDRHVTRDRADSPAVASTRQVGCGATVSGARRASC